MAVITEFHSELRCKELRADGKYNHHRVDIAGNVFINGKCVNPKKNSGLAIGENYEQVANPLPTVLIG